MSSYRFSKRQLIIGIAAFVILVTLSSWMLYFYFLGDYKEENADIIKTLTQVVLTFLAFPTFFFVLTFIFYIEDKRKNKGKVDRENHYKIIEKITSKIQNEKCNICKLTLKEFEVIVQCPEGKSYFHKAHLDEWLLDKEKCPICGIKLRGIEN